MSREPSRAPDATRDAAMPPAWGGDATFAGLDPATRLLVRAAAAVAAGSEDEVRSAIAATLGRVPPVWMEEMILQSYLFAGFPRTLNAAREWRRLSDLPAPATDAESPASPDAAGGSGEGSDVSDRLADWRRRGEATCATVYGAFYEPLRANIRALHPALDDWMIVDGYGKVLGRPGLDLKRRELCIVAVCAATRQHRQLHSHLHGARHAGATSAEVAATIDAVAPMLGDDDTRSVRMLWDRVRGKTG